MHKFRIDTAGLSPDETDRLIAAIFQYLKNELHEIHLEIGHPMSRSLQLPITAASGDSQGHAPFYEIPLKQILYVTSDRHYCDIRTIHGLKRFRITFHEIARMLPEDLFLTCNRGVILAMTGIREHTEDYFIMSDGAIFSLNTRHRKEIIRRYESFRTRYG